MSQDVYDQSFIRYAAQSSASSAGRIVPFLHSALGVGSVLDVGCAAGTWLAAWRASGVDDIYGLDGNYVDKRALEIPLEAFISADVSSPFDSAGSSTWYSHWRSPSICPPPRRKTS